MFYCIGDVPRATAGALSRAKVRLALVGFGSVGKSLLHLLQVKEAELAALGFSWTITAVISGSRGLWLDPAGLPADELISRAASGAGWPHRAVAEGPAGPPVAAGPATLQAVLDAAAADVVIETTPLDPEAGQPALDYLRLALGAGVSVVTANKGPIAHGYTELRELAAATGAKLAFESTVMDGAPVFSLVARTLPATTVDGIRGVLNSTSNYVLDQVSAGVPADEAVRQAQLQGVAEADPSLDLDGWDAATKLSVLSHVLLGVRIRPAEIPRDPWPPPAAAGPRPRQLASVTRHAPGAVRASVRWAELRPDDPLAAVRGMSTALTLVTDTLGELTVTIKDPTTEQTAYGVLADLLAVSAALAR
jgi:homoserine dehydrogenase